MEWSDFTRAVESQFGFPVNFNKEKAGHIMLEWPYDTCFGPVCGHTCPSRFWAIVVDGWAYQIKDSKWYLLRDGLCGWRRGTNPAPSITEASDVQ